MRGACSSRLLCRSSTFLAATWLPLSVATIGRATVPALPSATRPGAIVARIPAAILDLTALDARWISILPRASPKKLPLIGRGITDRG